MTSSVEPRQMRFTERSRHLIGILLALACYSDGSTDRQTTLDPKEKRPMTARTKALCAFMLGALAPYYLQAQTTQPVPITPPPPPAVITFPQDLYDHPNELTEWWYYTGNLRGVNGKHYGF